MAGGGGLDSLQPSVPRPSARTKIPSNKPPIQRLCPASQIFVERLETTSWGVIWTHVTDAETLLEMGREHCAHLARPDQELVDEAKARIQELKQEDRNLSRMMKEAADDEAYDEKEMDVLSRSVI